MKYVMCDTCRKRIEENKRVYINNKIPNRIYCSPLCLCVDIPEVVSETMTDDVARRQNQEWIDTQ